MNPFLAELIASKTVVAPDGTRHELHSEISVEEGLFLQNIIRENKPKVSLEIGCAFGISSLFICEALSEVGATKHMVIDPHQRNPDLWKGIGLANLKRAGYGGLIEFYEGYSLVALPLIYTKKTKVDFAFIDGMHTFDYVLVDFFYVDKLLNVGGIVAFDDYTYPAIKKVVRYVMANLPYAYVGAAEIDDTVLEAPGEGEHPNLAGLPGKARCVALRKLKDNSIGKREHCNRSWDTHHAF